MTTTLDQACADLWIAKILQRFADANAVNMRPDKDKQDLYWHDYAKNYFAGSREFYRDCQILGLDPSWVKSILDRYKHAAEYAGISIKKGLYRTEKAVEVVPHYKYYPRKQIRKSTIARSKKQI